MNNVLMKAMAVLLAFTMVITLGVGAYAEGLNPEGEPTSEEEQIAGEGELPPADSVESEEPTEGKGPEEDGNPVEPGNPIEGKEPGDLGETTDPEAGGNPVDPEDPIDSGEPIDQPTVIAEDISHENMPEGYVIDEEISTELPFTVGEDGDVIEVYYVLEDEEGLVANQLGIGVMAAGGLQDNYNATSEVFPLNMNSTNPHTKARLAWLDGNDLYLAIGSRENAPLKTVKYNNVVYTDEPNYQLGPGETKQPLAVDRANLWNDILTINDPSNTDYTASIADYYPSNSKDKYRWNVVYLGPVTLTSPFFVDIITTLGGGHDVRGIQVTIASSLQVYHQYEGVTGEVFDTNQSGSLGQNFGYSVHPVYNYNGETYELTDIKVEHNGALQVDIGLDDLIDGFLSGVVDGTLQDRSAKITFIYKKASNGQINITKTVINPKDPDKEFDIFVKDSSGKEWTVVLTNGQNKTITKLPPGTYTIREIVPMNYKLNVISGDGSYDNSTKEFTVTVANNTIRNVTVENERNNDGYFHDEDTRKNKFDMRIVVEPQGFIIPEEIILEEELDIFIDKEDM